MTRWYGRQQETTVLKSQVTSVNMKSFQVKYSGSKIVPRLELRVGITREEINLKEYKGIATWMERKDVIMMCEIE